MLGDNAVLITTLYDVGEPDHPEVEAVITLPGVLLPVRETDPPVGTTTDAVQIAYSVKLSVGVNTSPA